MKRVGMPVVIALTFTVGVAGQSQWPQWRGPALNGVVPGDAPTDVERLQQRQLEGRDSGPWILEPGRLGRPLFLTTAVPTGKVGRAPGRRRRPRRWRQCRG